MYFKKRDIFRFVFACLCSWPFAVLSSEDATAKTLLEIAKTALSLNAHLSYFADCAFKAALHIRASETKWIVEVFYDICLITNWLSLSVHLRWIVLTDSVVGRNMEHLMG